MSLNAIVGQDGIIEKAEKAADETERAGIKEEIELKIANIQMEQDKVGKELSKEDIENTLNELEGIDVDTIGNTIDGEYKNHSFEIDEENNVIVGKKIEGEKPTGAVILKTTDEIALEVKLQVVGEVRGKATIESIEAIDKEKVEEIEDESNRTKLTNV